MVRTGVAVLLFTSLGSWAGYGLAAAGAEQFPGADTEISAALFQVSPGHLSLTRDLVPQLVFNKQPMEQPPIERLQQGLDTAWLDYLHRSAPIAPLAVVPTPVVEEPVAVTAVPVISEPYPDPYLIQHHDAPLPLATNEAGMAALSIIPDSVPDPGPLGFLGLGLIALALVRKRRRNKNGRLIGNNPAFGV